MERWKGTLHFDSASCFCLTIALSCVCLFVCWFASALVLCASSYVCLCVVRRRPFD